ncbi:MAG: sulfatase-like hydrolase/transferase [Bacteroidetes bacterium]|nr:sulfatase-like hydrolase/transferase [Bacteroidota bacterium]
MNSKKPFLLRSFKTGGYNPPFFIPFLIAVYMTGIFFFFLCRVVLVLMNLFASGIGIHHGSLIFYSFLMGLRFDTVISCYILAIPFPFLLFSWMFPIGFVISIKISRILILTGYLLSFFICWVDIPYYNFFHSRLNSVVFNWFHDPGFVFRMIFSEWTFWIFIIPFLIYAVCFIMISRKYHNLFFSKKPVSISRNLLIDVPVILLIGSLIFLGIRGRIKKKSPIRTGTAYFCEVPFLNHLGLNPAFTLVSSGLEDLKDRSRPVKLIPEQEAVVTAEKYLGIRPDSLGKSEFSRSILYDGSPRKLNVILILMEGMSEYFRGKHGGPENLTPVLDSLTKQSLNFENIFSSGIHTYNGIYSTLFSYPALLKQHPMLKIPSRQYEGMPLSLKRNGYRTMFFIAHDDQFDNTGGFLIANGFDRIYSQKDYPGEKILSTLGVPDDYLYEFSITVFNGYHRSGQPFFAGFMTASNHDPIIIPEWADFKPNSNDKKEMIIEYCDWSLGKFIKLCSREPWYGSTIFVITADHGSGYPWVYEMPLTYHHIPLIIHAPGLNIKPESLKNPGGQIDIFPTIMGLLNISYSNNTFGTDLLSETRPFIFFTADDKIGCADKDYFFIHLMGGSEYLYRYNFPGSGNVITDFREKADSMKRYAFSMLQAAQWKIKNELQ